jgi:hypothetical protein
VKDPSVVEACAQVRGFAVLHTKSAWGVMWDMMHMGSW